MRDRLVNRHTIYLWFKQDFLGLPEESYAKFFTKLSDEALAKRYKLTILRAGFFY